MITATTANTIATLAEKLAAAIANGGASLNLDGTEVQNGYTIGGGILNTKDAMAVYNLADATEYELFVTISENWEELQKFDGVGCWVSNGKFYLDAITVEQNLIPATILGLSRKQQAIGKIANGEYVEELPMQTVDQLEEATTESGFSLIELAVSTAIMAILMASGFSILLPLVDTMQTKVDSIEQQQLEQQLELKNYLANIGN
jgi:prepilin-type N-terminal cleavage/methylation domain-containing protein